MEIIDKLSDLNEQFNSLIKEARAVKEGLGVKQSVVDRRMNDYLHILELSEDLTYHQYARLAKAMKATLQDRRKLKDETDAISQVTGLHDCLNKMRTSKGNMEKTLGSERKRSYKMRELGGTIDTFTI